MDSQDFPAPSRGAPDGDGASSGFASPGVRNRVMGAIDSRCSGGMSLLIREGEAGVASSSAHPLAEEPLTAPQRAPSSMNPGGSSWQPPFFNSNSASPSSRGPSSYLFSIHDPVVDDTCRNPDPDLRSHDGRLSLFHTFYFSPSASRSSGAFSLCSSHPSGSTGETQSIMPGPTFDAPAEHRFVQLNAADADYFLPAIAPTSTAIDTAQLRPHSAGSVTSGRTASPLGFARWTKRHHQQHYHHQSNNHNRHDEEVHMLKGRDCGPAERKANSRSGPRRLARSRSTSVQKRQQQAGAVPQMTREEFEALPLAIQRKYFSTLERLRFAQESGLVDGISQHYDDISNFKRRRPRRRGSVTESRPPTSDSLSLCAGPQEATDSAGIFLQEQLPKLRLRPRASVILDAADEAIFKLNQQASRRNVSTVVDVLTPPLSPTRDSMESQDGFGKLHDRSGESHTPQSFFDSFRWLEEEEDLDLRLFLDDYHANLREGTPNTKQRPSFRRHMSINKLPFGRRSSVSSTRPRTKDAMGPTSPVQSSADSVSNELTHARRKSRALSLITPKHAAQPSITAFDPAAAHYQDPEARLKLRVYLASPQKFDEAVEFGFPSADVLSPAPVVGDQITGLSRRQSRQKLADEGSNMRSFLADHDDDDNVSLSSDGQSLADPDSPKTPEPMEYRAGTPRHTRYASAGVLNGRDPGRRTPEGGFYAQAPAASREMTLRMTLTRPDLRAHEDEIYGWQQRQAYQQHSRRPTGLASLTAENRGAYLGNESRKASLEKFPDVDHWNDTTTAEKGVMRRIWNKVRRG